MTKIILMQGTIVIFVNFFFSCYNSTGQPPESLCLPYQHHSKFMQDILFISKYWILLKNDLKKHCYEIMF